MVAVLLYAGLVRFTGHPVATFSISSAITFVVTRVPDSTYIPTVPGASIAQTAVLVLMHVLDAAVIVRLLTSIPARRGHSSWYRARGGRFTRLRYSALNHAAEEATNTPLLLTRSQHIPVAPWNAMPAGAPRHSLATLPSTPRLVAVADRQREASGAAAV